MSTKLPNRPFKFRAENGEVLEFASLSTVDGDGLFSLSVPDELKESLGSVLKNHHEAEKFRAASVHLRRPRDKLYVSGTTLAACSRAIEVAAAEHLRCEVTRERIIAYANDIKVSYTTDEAGNFFANGFDVGAPKKGGAHRGTLHATERAEAFSVGFAARVYDKVTHRRASGQKVVYAPPEDFDHIDVMSYGERLNCFVGLRLDPGSMKQMPYTEEAARFMYETLLGMCRLAERLQTFFDDEPRLLGAIERQVPLLALRAEEGGRERRG